MTVGLAVAGVAVRRAASLYGVSPLASRARSLVDIGSKADMGPPRGSCQSLLTQGGTLTLLLSALFWRRPALLNRVDFDDCNLPRVDLSSAMRDRNRDLITGR